MVMAVVTPRLSLDLWPKHIYHERVRSVTPSYTRITTGPTAMWTISVGWLVLMACAMNDSSQIVRSSTTHKIQFECRYLEMTTYRCRVVLSRKQLRSMVSCIMKLWSVREKVTHVLVTCATLSTPTIRWRHGSQCVCNFFTKNTHLYERRIECDFLYFTFFTFGVILISVRLQWKSPPSRLS